jgi:hypothetical protein
VRAEPAGEFLHHGGAVVAPLADHVGGAEFQGQLLPGLVTAHRDNALGSQLASGQHREQADSAVADDRDGLAGPGLGCDGAEPGGTQHVGGSEQVWNQRVGRNGRGGDERSVGEWHPQQLGLRAARPHVLDVSAAALIAGLADRAGVVRGHERADHELPGPDGPYPRADLFDNADILVAHRRGLGHRVGAAPGPQV